MPARNAYYCSLCMMTVVGSIDGVGPICGDTLVASRHSPVQYDVSVNKLCHTINTTIEHFFHCTDSVMFILLQLL